MTQTKFIGALLIACGVAAAKPQNQSENTARMAAGADPIYRVTVTSRTTKAINYRHRGGATKINFKGTDLLPAARGEAKVESKQGYIEIEVEFDNLEPATKNGAEYLTYVMWAITPEGRPSNLGEVLLNGTKSKLNVTTELQVFGLIITAEPYYAVTQPSDLIVMQNVVRPDTLGKIEEVDAKYELLQRGQYQRMTNPLMLKMDGKMPLELYEARNAVQIARSMGADRFATETFQKAEKSLEQAEAYQARKAGKKPVTMMAREAVQTAEDSRAIAVKRQEENALAAERRQSLDRENRAETGRIAALSAAEQASKDADATRMKLDRERAEGETRAAAARAEADRLKSENEAQRMAKQAELDNAAKASAAAIAEANRLKLQSDVSAAAAGIEAERAKLASAATAAAAKAEVDRLKAENDARMAASAVAAKAEVDRLKSENDARMAASAATAKAEADRLKMENDARMAASAAEADRMKRENEARIAAKQAELDNAAKQKAQLEKEKVELRTQLLLQFNAILQTQDTARGLIVNMSDVLFDTGKFSLRSLAREKLAKVAGIVSGHPGLKLDVEGHTDSVGNDDYNQKLSENRGTAVRDYLTQQGMPGSSVTTKGLGETQPIATNDTAAGRQKNRRVEIVISGDIIGGSPLASK